MKLSTTVKRGKSIGIVLTPHMYQNGSFVVSKTRFEKDYVFIKNENELLEWLHKGYKLRMSNPHVESHTSPSLISLKSINIES